MFFDLVVGCNILIVRGWFASIPSIFLSPSPALSWPARYINLHQTQRRTTHNHTSSPKTAAVAAAPDLHHSNALNSSTLSHPPKPQPTAHRVRVNDQNRERAEQRPATMSTTTNDTGTSSPSPKKRHIHNASSPNTPPQADSRSPLTSPTAEPSQVQLPVRPAMQV